MLLSVRAGSARGLVSSSASKVTGQAGAAIWEVRMIASHRRVGLALGGLALGVAVSVASISAAFAQKAIDNSSLAPPPFRKHITTYGLVYVLPKDVTDVLDAKIRSPLKEKLIQAGLSAETKVSNIPHVTVMHLHSADKTTPAKMLKAVQNCRR
jgi:hypothetical protein